MKTFKLFGCQDFITGGKIVAIISLLENFVKIVVSAVFLLLVRSGSVKELKNGGKSSLKSETIAVCSLSLADKRRLAMGFCVESPDS
jgi:hypothetical protein